MKSLLSGPLLRREGHRLVIGASNPHAVGCLRVVGIIFLLVGLAIAALAAALWGEIDFAANPASRAIPGALAIFPLCGLLVLIVTANKVWEIDRWIIDSPAGALILIEKMRGQGERETVVPLSWFGRFALNRREVETQSSTSSGSARRRITVYWDLGVVPITGGFWNLASTTDHQAARDALGELNALVDLSPRGVEVEGTGERTPFTSKHRHGALTISWRVPFAHGSSWIVALVFGAFAAALVPLALAIPTENAPFWGLALVWSMAGVVSLVSLLMVVRSLRAIGRRAEVTVDDHEVTAPAPGLRRERRRIAIAEIAAVLIHVPAKLPDSLMIVRAQELATLDPLWLHEVESPSEDRAKVRRNLAKIPVILYQGVKIVVLDLGSISLGDRIVLKARIDAELRARGWPGPLARGSEASEHPATPDP